MASVETAAVAGTPGFVGKLETKKEKGDRLAAEAIAETKAKSDADAKAAADRRKQKKKNRKKAAKAAARIAAAAAAEDDEEADDAGSGGSGDDSKAAGSGGGGGGSKKSERKAPVRPIVKTIAPPQLPPSTVYQSTEYINVQAIPGKGKGCIASKLIPLGACILNETGLSADFHESRGATDAAAVLAAELLTRDDCSDLYFENTDTNGVKHYPVPLEQANKGIDDARWSMAMAQVTTNCFVKKLRDGEAPAPDEKSVAAAVAAGPTSTTVTRGDLDITTVKPVAPTTPPDSRLIVYPIGARFNHSCWPNAHIIQQDGKGYVYALEPIAPGTEITICYRSEFLLLPTKRRQIMLKISHIFDCRCIRCVPPAPTATDSKSAPSGGVTAAADTKQSTTATVTATATAAAAASPAPTTAPNDSLLELTVPSPLPFADRELMDARFAEAEKIHAAYTTLEDVSEGITQWSDFLKVYGAPTSVKRLHVCHWKMFKARTYLIEALQTLSQYDTGGGGLSNKHRKLLLSVLAEQLECLELIVPLYHNIKVIYYKSYIAVASGGNTKKEVKLPSKLLEERWKLIKEFFKL